MKKISNISFITEVRIKELPEIMESVAAIVEKHNPEALGINGMFQLLKAEQPGLKALKVRTERTNPNRERFLQLQKSQMDLIVAIRNQCKVIRKANVAAQSEHLNVVYPYVKLYLNSFEKRSSLEKQSDITQFLTELKQTALQTSLTESGLKLYVDSLSSIQEELQAVYVGNKEAITTRKRSEMQLNKANALAAFRNLISAIELAVVEHTTRDYSVLITELNNYLSLQSATVKARRTRRLNYAKKETAASTPTSIATAS